MEDINVVIAGMAGEGIQTVGAVLAKTVSAQGYAVFTWKEYESRIRGGRNSFSIRIGDAPKNAPLAEADILLSFDDAATAKYTPLVKPGGIRVLEKVGRDKDIAIPFGDIARELGGVIYANAVAVGALAAMLGIEAATLMSVIGKTFAKKGDRVADTNIAAAEKGFSLATQGCRGMCPWRLPRREGRYYLIGGNEAVSLGAVRGGCRFISAYPMTPSTGIITFLAKRGERLGVFAEQAEDEIAAINMAIGASYGGARAMTATSGGGFALMVEGVSLAGMTETPVVIVLGQRPGPATGLPTRTGQGELLFAINAGHGEFPKMVMAPSDPKDAFHKTVRAFNMADKYQIPVILLTDQFLADSMFSITDFEIEKAAPLSFHGDPVGAAGYGRYRLTDDGVSPRLYPGESRHLVCADSDEHDEQGHITEDLSGMAVPMVEKRLAKLKGLKKEMQGPEERELDEAQVVLVGWGSTRQAVLEAMDLLAGDGIRAGMIHFTELWPLPDYTFRTGKRYWSVESNATSQLARLLRSEYPVFFDGSVNRYDGLPMTGDYIRRHVHA